MTCGDVRFWIADGAQKSQGCISVIINEQDKDCKAQIESGWEGCCIGSTEFGGKFVGT